MAEQANGIAALGNRLLALKQSPGYSDLFHKSRELVQWATDTLVNYPGWDEKEIAVLKARAQAAKEFHHLLFGFVDESINAAQQSYAETVQNEQTAINEADEIRKGFLKKLDDMFGRNDKDMRIAGSY